MTRENRIEAAKCAIKELTSSAINEHGFIPGYVQCWCDAINEYIKMDEAPFLFINTPQIPTQELLNALKEMKLQSLQPLKQELSYQDVLHDACCKMQRNDFLAALDKLDISLTDIHGTYRNVADILNEISVKWRGAFN